MLSFVCLSVLLGLGYWLRRKLIFLQRLYLPASVIAGLLGLILINTLPIPDIWTAGWSRLPGILINLVFACLFLGVEIPGVSKVWKSAGRQLAYGQIVAWGQYVVGIGIALFALAPLFGLNELFGATLPVGFEGGHGTAGGLGPVFDELGWAAGKDFALASATAGIVSAIIVGMVLVNWAVRKGYVSEKKPPHENIEEEDWTGSIPHDQRPKAGKLTVSSDVIEALSLHLVIVAGAILIGYGLKELLLLIQGIIPFAEKHDLLGSFPLFPLCMLGGLLIQIFANRFDPNDHIDHGLTRRIQNTSLDFLVVAAIATIRLNVVAQGWLPLLILVTAGILWNVACVLFLARRVFKTAWFERSIAEMGQSMGVTATGLLLLRVVDPDYKTPAAEAFACKQLMHEPIMGGGLWTGMAIPLIAAIGAAPVFGIACAAVAVWALILFIPKGRRHE
ncbi:sodium/glutamate symporter [Tichowtungia aerotolerans]|uniref:Sodium:glutamate symporter n=1 Tax=Tichowtungia aerotolerans TaxID=2697043 RepID=A0A6P1M1E8_9BACT|nr:sodium/glutamate symporter [Tichowtungia aerotolerans]QHI68649.1 sodium:glutamate symporter [Tichowtungia aerotolerans]